VYLGKKIITQRNSDTGELLRNQAVAITGRAKTSSSQAFSAGSRPCMHSRFSSLNYTITQQEECAECNLIYNTTEPKDTGVRGKTIAFLTGSFGQLTTSQAVNVVNA